MKRYAIKVRVMCDYLYEVDAETQEKAEERAIEMADNELDRGDFTPEFYSASVLLTGDRTSMFDQNVSSELDQNLHDQM